MIKRCIVCGKRRTFFALNASGDVSDECVVCSNEGQARILVANTEEILLQSRMIVARTQDLHGFIQDQRPGS